MVQEQTNTTSAKVIRAEFRPFIYALVDPRDPKHVRYVGMAPSNPRRPYEHAKLARKEVTKPTYLVKWLRKIQSEGREPDVLILERLPEGTGRKFLGFVESCYIKSLRTIGHSLTNDNDGGWGGSNGPHTPETIARARARWTPELRAEEAERASKANRGRKLSPEARANQRASWTPERRAERAQAAKACHTGRVRPPEVRAKQSESAKVSWRTGERHGTPHTPEVRAKISKALTGREMSVEWRANNAAAQTGKKASAETRARQSASHKALWATISPEERSATRKAGWVTRRQRQIDRLTAQLDAARKLLPN